MLLHCFPRLSETQTDTKYHPQNWYKHYKCNASWSHEQVCRFKISVTWRKAWQCATRFKWISNTVTLKHGTIVGPKEQPTMAPHKSTALNQILLQWWRMMRWMRQVAWKGEMSNTGTKCQSASMKATDHMFGNNRVWRGRLHCTQSQASCGRSCKVHNNISVLYDYPTDCWLWSDTKLLGARA
jgi:hypothetical protein